MEDDLKELKARDEKVKAAYKEKSKPIKNTLETIDLLP